MKPYLILLLCILFALLTLWLFGLLDAAKRGDTMIDELAERNTRDED